MLQLEKYKNDVKNKREYMHTSWNASKFENMAIHK